MKKFLAGLALASVAVTFAASVWAAPVFIPIALSWRHQAGTFPNSFSDSSYFSLNSSNTAPAAVIDTSVAFSLPGRALTTTAIQLGTDSLTVFQFVLAPDNRQGSTGGLDSITVQLQGSLNGGQTWVGAPAIDLVQTTTGNFEKTWNSTVAASAPASTPTNVTMGYYDTFRILVKDFTGSSGQFIGRVRYIGDQSGNPVQIVVPR